jgi:hypothetical protein
MPFSLMNGSGLSNGGVVRTRVVELTFLQTLKQPVDFYDFGWFD